MPLPKPLWTVAALCLVLSAGCGFLRPLPKDVSLNQRLAAFPQKNLPLTGRVEILWNQNQIPFILAEKDEDLPFALGLVHAHLRLPQIETMRRISQGRLGEIMGPFVAKADHAIRIIDFPKAAGTIAKGLPPGTRGWLEGFLRGLNHYIEHVDDWPPELAMLGVKREPWSLEELLSVGRLACTDVNWLHWYGSLGVQKQPAWPKLWKRMKAVGLASHPSFLPPDNLPMGLTAGSVKSGSNCLAVSGDRTKSGAAFLANDAHVGLTLPALWLLVGMKSPSVLQVGFTMPGMPVVMMGRNRHIAWGGTNMLSFSSSLYDLSRLKNPKLTSRKETLRLRWWFDREITVRGSELGPVVSDAPFFEDMNLPPLALKWRGHTPSDETSAFLKINRAENWAQFRAAFASYAERWTPKFGQLC